MRKFIISITVIATLGFITQSCFDGLNDFTYKGPPVVEFSNLSHNNASWVSVGSFWAATVNINDGVVGDAAIQVALVGPHKAQSRQIGYYVVDQLYRDTDANRLTTEQPDHDEWVLLETTATAGTDYSIQDGGVITIPANSSFGSMDMEIFPSDEIVMYIVLEERDLAPSENYKFFRLTLRPLYELELNADPERGTVTGSGNYRKNTSVTIAAVAEYGYEFVEWTGDIAHVADHTSANTTVTMPQEKVTLTAEFIELPFFEVTLTASPAEGGTVDGDGEYLENEEVTITATPAEGYVFVEWTGDIDHIADPEAASTTLTVPASDVSLTAVFELD